MTRVTIITRADCHFCDEAKALLERLAPELDLQIEAIDLGTPEGQQMAIASGMVFPPAILIDGTAFSYGRLSERRLRQRLAACRSADSNEVVA